MKKIIRNTVRGAMAAMVVTAGITLTSCNAEPDDSNLYTFTGFTVEDFLAENDNLSSFNTILKQVGYDHILSSYGGYTCFAPTNDAIDRYLDSLYNDETQALENPHNGMDAPGLEGILTGSKKADSLCVDIAKFHVTGNSTTSAKALTVMDLTNKLNITMHLGRSVVVHIDSLSVNGPYLNDPSVYILNLDDPTEDKTAVNGVIHVISNVIPRDNEKVSSRMAKMTEFSLFNEALELTGLQQMLDSTDKQVFKDGRWENITYDKVGTYERSGETHYYISQDYESKRMFTVFAEPDNVLKPALVEKGYTPDIEGLKKFANDVYGNAASWYTYLNLNVNDQPVKMGNSVSTGTDYTARNNALNMFVAYHILAVGLSSDNVTTEYAVVPSGYHGWSGDAYDYYRTMLPNTLVKAWYVSSLKKTFLNRYIKNNTLTDALESRGSATMDHAVVDPGAEIDLANVKNPLNGYIYPIDKVLVYDAQVPQGVLRERMRIDWLSAIPEIINNGFRGKQPQDLANDGRTNGEVRVRFPNDFFDDIRVFNGSNTNLGLNVRAGYSLYQGDSFRHVGSVDYAIKLPPVPEGDYELRLDFTLANHFGMVQYYLGRSSDPNEMIALDIPMDCRMSNDDPRVGFKYLLDPEQYPNYSEDKGLSLDQEMRNRGWMFGPLSTVRETQKTNESYFVRFTNHQLRRIMTKQHFDQGDYWLRVKCVLPNFSDGVSQLDYVEFVPLDVVNNNRYLEDMY